MDIIDVRKNDLKKSSKKQKPASGRGLTALMAVLLVMAIGASLYFWNESRTATSQTPEAIRAELEERSANIVEALDKILLTNSEDQPTVVQVEDADGLRESQPDFYADASVDDYVIFYPQRVIIYRESENRIINVAPLIDRNIIQSNVDSPAPGQ